MIKLLVCELKTFKEFIKEFESVCEARKFIIKTHHSNHLVVMDAKCDTYAESEEIADLLVR